MLFISHDLSTVSYLSDRVAVMYLGKVVEVGPRRADRANPLHPYTGALLRSIPRPDPTPAAPSQPAARGDPQRHQPTARLPLPSALPAGFPGVPRNLPALGRKATRPLGRVPRGAARRMTHITRGFVTVQSRQRQVHYRRAGDGPPLILLHASPGSSAGLVTLIAALSERGRTVFALDTPGFGESDPLRDEHPSAADFARATGEALTALGVEQFDLYGAHTVRRSRSSWQSLHQSGLDRSCSTALRCTRPRKHAASSAPIPSPSREWDGSHVVRAWALRRDMSLFWPWYDKAPANRRELDMPSAERLHAQVVDMLRGATTYQLGYAAAFSHPTREAVTRLEPPTRIIFRESDVLGEHVARFPPLPSNVVVETLGREDELEQLVERIVSFGHVTARARSLLTLRKSHGLTRDYIQTRHGQIHIRRGGPGTGTPVLMLHDVPGSSSSLLPLAEQLAAERPVLVPDLPGCGDSDAPDWRDPDQSLAPYADLLAEVCDGVAVYGIGTGAVLALELASRHPARVRSLVLHDMPAYDPDAQADVLANATPAIEPSWDGAHLLTAWNIARNTFLFSSLVPPVGDPDAVAALRHTRRPRHVHGYPARRPRLGFRRPGCLPLSISGTTGRLQRALDPHRRARGASRRARGPRHTCAGANLGMTS